MLMQACIVWRLMISFSLCDKQFHRPFLLEAVWAISRFIDETIKYYIEKLFLMLYEPKIENSTY